MFRHPPFLEWLAYLWAEFSNLTQSVFQSGGAGQPTSHGTPVEGEDDFTKLVLSSHLYLGSRDQTQVTRLTKLLTVLPSPVLALGCGVCGVCSLHVCGVHVLCMCAEARSIQHQVSSSPTIYDLLIFCESSPTEPC